LRSALAIGGAFSFKAPARLPAGAAFSQNRLPQAACRPPASGAGGKASRLVGVRCIQLRRQPGRRLPERRLAAALTSLCVMV